MVYGQEEVVDRIICYDLDTSDVVNKERYTIVYATTSSVIVSDSTQPAKKAYWRCNFALVSCFLVFMKLEADYLVQLGSDTNPLDSWNRDSHAAIQHQYAVTRHIISHPDNFGKLCHGKLMLASLQTHQHGHTLDLPSWQAHNSEVRTIVYLQDRWDL